MNLANTTFSTSKLHILEWIMALCWNMDWIELQDVRFTYSFRSELCEAFVLSRVINSKTGTRNLVDLICWCTGEDYFLVRDILCLDTNRHTYCQLDSIWHLPVNTNENHKIFSQGIWSPGQDLNQRPPKYVRMLTTMSRRWVVTVTINAFINKLLRIHVQVWKILF